MKMSIAIVVSFLVVILLIEPAATQTITKPHDCADVMMSGITTTGIYTVYPGKKLYPVKVYCDMTTAGGGWTVFQRRINGKEDFNRTWNDYSAGFGKPDGELWLGNHHLYQLTKDTNYALRVDMTTMNGTYQYAQYDLFRVSSECDNFKLTVQSYDCGGAGDSMAYNSGAPFSTYDRDLDSYSSNCALNGKGGWWYKACSNAQLNGPYDNQRLTAGTSSIVWNAWSYGSQWMQKTEMKIRPADFI